MATMAYCISCKSKREMKNPQKFKMKNGRMALRGTCPKCGNSIFRIGG